VKLLGGQLASVGAFSLITSVPVQPDTDPADSDRHRWVDRISAPRDEHYVYRMRPLNALGEEAPWPADAGGEDEIRDRCILILQKNRDPLQPPSIYELEPLDRAIGIVVRRPAAGTITGLRIYKTDDAARAADVRTMTLIHGTIAFTHARIETLPATLPAAGSAPARVRFVDAKVSVGAQYFYRVELVDRFGNISPPSEAMAATPRALKPPQPPTLAAQRTDENVIKLWWEAEHEEGRVKLQRKRSGESAWVDVTGEWLLPTDNASDADAAGIVAHRLLLRDERGRLVHSAPLITGA
jgi:hypothetical protein